MEVEKDNVYHCGEGQVEISANSSQLGEEFNETSKDYSHTREDKLMTHDYLVERAAKWLKSFGCGIVFDDRFQARTESGERPDAIGFRHDVSVLIECKATRSDFLSDKRKKFRIDPQLGVGDWRFYLCPPGIIKVEDLPCGWGLLYCHPNKIERVHGIPVNKVDLKEKPFTGNHVNEKKILYSALRRLEILGKFDEIYNSNY